MRLCLQLAVFIFGFVPVLAGGYGVLYGADNPLSDSITITTDSHLRYLSGLLMGIGFLFWTFIPHIETKKTEFRLLTVIVFMGGLSRLYGLVITGMPSAGILFALGMELAVTPALCWWQSRLQIV